jgi:hypothetical protein
MADFSESMVHIVNRALVKLGQPPSFSIDDDSDLAGIVDLTWPGLAAEVVAKYDWSASKLVSKLIPVTDPPDVGWSYGFMLPGNRIGEPLAFLTSPHPPEAFLRDHMIANGLLYANCADVWCRYRGLVDPQYWDLGFAEAFCTAYAARLAVPLLEDQKLAQFFNELAFGRVDQNDGGGLFGKLITINRSSMPQGRQFMANNPLANARYR